MDFNVFRYVGWLCGSWLNLPTRKLCIHFVYKNCTRCMQLMYTKWMQNVYHISTNLCIHFVYKIKRTMPAKFCIQNLYKSLLKCGIHFVYEHFVYILYTSILMYKIHTFIYKSLYAGYLISTYFDPIVVHFLVNHCKHLRLETCWIFTGGT